jgi:homoserine kinase type II
MAVYTILKKAELQHYARLFNLGRLIRYTGIAEGTINTIYKLETSKGHFIFRILENRSLRDARFEQALLQHLAKAKLSVPKMHRPKGSEDILSLNPRQHLAVFDFMPGKVLEPSEFSPKHTHALGHFLARMHVQSQSLKRRRQNPFRLQKTLVLAKESQKVIQQAPERFLPAHKKDLHKIQTRLKRYNPEPHQCPQAIIHGDLFPENALFTQEKLEAVIDFEMASTGFCIYDVAVALCAWAYTSQGHMNQKRGRALLDSYQDVRPLMQAEKNQLFKIVAYSLSRFSMTRFFDFEVSLHPDVTRNHKDYKEMLTRLEKHEALGARKFHDMLIDN